MNVVKLIAFAIQGDDEQDSDQDEQDIKQDLNNIAAFQDVQLIPPSGSGDNLKKTIQNKEDVRCYLF